MTTVLGGKVCRFVPFDALHQTTRHMIIGMTMKRTITATETPTDIATTLTAGWKEYNIICVATGLRGVSISPLSVLG